MATNIVRKGLNQRWTDIRRLSRSHDDFDRTSALAHSVACIEMGLAALGIASDRSRGVQSRLFTAAQRMGLRDLPSSAEMKSAFAARNHAVHEHHVPTRDACQGHVASLSKIWNSLRRHFVNREHATRLAVSILETTGISDVFLFGSLAHRSRGYAHDIDLLLFDEGEFSAFGTGYGSVEPAMIEEQLGALVNQYAVRCGWLDFIIVDGTRFGVDADYTSGLTKRHWDSLFFVNISDGLLKYDPTKRKWTDAIPQIFQRLAGLRKQLETELIVSPQSKKWKKSRRRGKQRY